MEEKILTFLKSVGENYGPAIVAGAIGAVIARLRHRMSPRQFIGSIIISIFVSVSVGAVAKDYLLIQQESIINFRITKTKITLPLIYTFTSKTFKYSQEYNFQIKPYTPLPNIF